MPNLNVAAGKAGNITFMKNGVDGVAVMSPHSNSFNMTINADTDWAKSGGSNKVRFDSNKTGTVALSFDVFSTPLLSVLFSMNTTVGATNIYASEYKLPTTTTITLASAPVAGTVYIAEVQDIDKYAHTGDVLTEGNPTSVGQFSVTGSSITINTADKDKHYRIYYMKASAATAIKNQVTTIDFPVGYTIAFDTIWKGANDNSAIPVQIIARNAVPQVSTSIDMTEGTHATIDITLDLFGDSDDVMFEMIEL